MSERRQPSGPDHTFTILAYGVGAAGLAVGSVFGLATFNKKGELEDDCPNKACPGGSQGDIDAGNRYALVSDIGFGVGIGGAALGTYLLLTTQGSERAAPSRTAAHSGSVSAWIGAGAAGLSGAF